MSDTAAQHSEAAHELCPACRDRRPAPDAGPSWWRRNRVFFTHVLPVLLICVGFGWQLAVAFAPAKQPVNRFYIVCPDNPHQWCSHIGVNP